jgi:hypothetical protein
MGHLLRAFLPGMALHRLNERLQIGASSAPLRGDTNQPFSMPRD